MTTFKKAGQGIVAQSFTCDPTAVFVGDTVCITADNTVGYSATETPIGEVVAVDKHNLKCTVELRGAKIETAIADGVIAANDLLKVGGARGKVKTATPVTVAADIPLVMGVAFAAAADGATVTYMVL